MIDQSTVKKYPRDEADIKSEKEIVDHIKKLPLEQRFQAIALNNYILMRKQLDVEVEDQIQEIVRKYNKLQAPLMQIANDIISGKRAPTEEDLQDAKEHFTAEEIAQIPQNLTNEPIPEYWFKVLTSCIKLKQDIFEEDHALLKCVTGIEHVPEDEGESFSFRFYFSPNEYIENDVLTVRFVMIDENECGKTQGTEIKWKEGKDITKKTVTKKQKNKKTGKTRTVTKTVDSDSFFNFFKTIDANEEEMEDEEENEDFQRLDINYDIAVTLQDEIMTYNLEYFLGLRVGDEEDEDMEDLEGIDEEDDDDDEDEQPRHHGKKGAHKNKAEGGAKGGEKPECKQQ